MPAIPETNRFHPDQKRGLPFQIGVFLIAASLAGGFFYFASLQFGGLIFILLMALGLAACIPLPILAYRAYALWGGYYELTRDGMRLRWGLRIEDIPIGQIEWIRPISDLVAPLPMPRFTWRGAILGARQVRELGMIEYIASEKDKILLIATPDRIYAISPEDTEGFIRTFYRLAEMGSLSSYPAASVYPVVLVSTVWDDRTARYMILAGLVLWIAVIFWSIVLITNRPQISLGFDLNGTPNSAVPVIQIILLPILNAFIYLIDLAGGFYYYRRDPQRPISYLLWSSAGVTSILFLVALLLISLQ
jgi:hypothetical protein